MKIEKITVEDFDKVEAGRPKSKWNEIIGNVKKDKQPVKISGLTRGQVAAGYRKAKDEKLRVKADYKNGMLLIAP